jgi:hypothetical protein
MSSTVILYRLPERQVEFQARRRDRIRCVCLADQTSLGHSPDQCGNLIPVDNPAVLKRPGELTFRKRPRATQESQHCPFRKAQFRLSKLDLKQRLQRAFCLSEISRKRRGLGHYSSPMLS